MKILLASIAAAGLALSTGAALAQQTAVINPDASFEGIDTDRSGDVSWVEFALIFEDAYTEEQFELADLDASGGLSEDEFDTLVVGTGSIGRSDEQVPSAPQSLESLSTFNE